MSPGIHGIRIDYKELRKINPEAARQTVIECLKTNGHNIADTARVFRVNKTVVYDILAKSKEGNLKDRPKIPKHQPRQKIKSFEASYLSARHTGAPAWIRTKDVYFIRVALYR